MAKPTGPGNGRKRLRLAAVAAAVAVAIAAVVAGAAFADVLSIDADSLSPGQGTVQFGGTNGNLCDATVNGTITVNFNGNAVDDNSTLDLTKHYKPGESLTVTLTPSVSGLTATTGTVPNVPSTWGTSNTDSLQIPIHTSISSTLADGNYSVAVTVVGDESPYYDAGSGPESPGRPIYPVSVSCGNSSGGSTNHAPTVGVDNPSVTVNEGSQASNTGTYNDSDGDPVNLTASYGTVTKDPGGVAGTWSWSATPDDGPSDSQTVTITATDSHNASGTGTFGLTVNNVAPTMGSITGPTNVLTGSSYSYSYSVSATDPSNADTSAGFNWAWDTGSGTFGSYSSASASPNSVSGVSFSSCGSTTIRAKAKDKDNGEATPASLSVSAYTGQFLPPLTAGIFNAVQKGQVVPVKISIGCNGVPLTGLTPLINLKSGEADPNTDLSDPTQNVATSVSAADTSGQMRPIDGGYIYNLAVPSNATANSLYTIYVRPFGGTSPVMMVVLKIRK